MKRSRFPVIRPIVFAVALFVMMVVMSSGAVQAASTVETVKNRGFVLCGVTDRVPGFSQHEADGSWSGFFVDYCRAVGAAVLGNADAVQIESYWLDALEGREIDILHAGSTWTLSRDTTRMIDFPGIYFYDGQGFILHSNLGVKSLKDAMATKDLKVCAIGPSSTARANLEEFIANTGVTWTLVPIQTMDGMWRAFFGGRCDMAIHDRSALVAVHAGRLDDSNDYVVLPEIISKEPLAPAVRSDDVQWRDLVFWVTMATIAAEDLGVTQDNVDDMLAHSTSPEVRRLLGADPGLGVGFGLGDDWAYQVIKQLGNYGEIFARNLGPKTQFKMSRGLNQLWRDGGLLYAPPIR